jgi:hypothetical protein
MIALHATRIKEVMAARESNLANTPSMSPSG